MNKKALTITANSTSKTYGTALTFAGTEFTSSGLVNADTVTSVALSSAGAAAAATVVGSPYAIVASAASGAGLSNYTITYINGSLLVTARAVTVTADALNKIVGSADPTLTYQITSGSLVPGDTFTGVLSRTAGEGVGAYPILIGSLALNTSYVLTFVSANFTITNNAVPGSFNAFESSVATNDTTGKIFTKLAGIAFSLDVVAISSNAKMTSFNAAPVVQLLGNQMPGVLLDGNNCPSSFTLIQTVAPNPSISSGRSTVNFSAVATAWQDVRVRISYGSPAVISCSTDNFSIRPPGFTSVISGAPLNMNNAATSGTPRAIAGSGTFTLIATTGVAGYNGTPKHNNAAVQAHLDAKQNGAVSGTFPAALAGTGTSTGTSAFTYSEVGNFKFLGRPATAGSNEVRGVYDDTFTSVDDPADCTADFSNVPVNGKYGCKFGIMSDTSFFGRFYPANFALTSPILTNRQLAACATASTFTYAGEAFGLAFTLTAKNGASPSSITQNYDPVANFASLNAGTIVNFNFGAVDMADATPPLTATALSSNLTGSAIGIWANGAVSVTADLMLTRDASAKGPFESFNVGIDPIDADGVKLSSYDLDTTVPADSADKALVGVTSIRFGRLALSNAHGSELLNLPIPVQAQYWKGSSFATNIADSCTVIAAGNVAMSNYQKNLTPCETIIAEGGPLVNGKRNMRLSKPGAGNSGSVNLRVNLDTATGNTCLAAGAAASASSALKAYLQGGSAFNADPMVRATFGIYKSGPVIYLREMY